MKKWFEKNSTFFSDEMRSVSSLYPDLHFIIKDKKVFINGKLDFIASYNNEMITDSYLVSIELPDDYPLEHPYIKEVGERIPPDYHKLEGDYLCLATEMEVSRFINREKAILPYINKLLISYLYRFSYIQKYGKEPFGERQHGLKGKLEFYMEEFGTQEIPVIIRFLKLLLNKRISGHSLCPCGSGKHLRTCHYKSLAANSGISKNIIKSEINKLSKLEKQYKL